MIVHIRAGNTLPDVAYYINHAMLIHVAPDTMYDIFYPSGDY